MTFADGKRLGSRVFRMPRVRVPSTGVALGAFVDETTLAIYSDRVGKDDLQTYEKYLRYLGPVAVGGRSSFPARSFTGCEPEHGHQPDQRDSNT